MKTALGTLLQLFSKGSSEEMESILDQWSLESLRPFVNKKDDPGQEDHPEKEEPRGILKRGNGSIMGSPQKPKRVKFWDENPPILKVFRVQDHHGHVPEEHSGEEEKLLQKINDGEEDQVKTHKPDRARLEKEEHRAAEDLTRSGLQMGGFPGVAQEFKASKSPSTIMVEETNGSFGDENLIGMAPQPNGFSYFSMWGLGLSAIIFVLRISGLKLFFLSVVVKVGAMEGEDISQGLFGQFFNVLYAMMIILVWEVFRWLMNHLTILFIPQFNRQMVENAELMVRLALKDSVQGDQQREEPSAAAPARDEKEALPKNEETREEDHPAGEEHRSEKRRKTETREPSRKKGRERSRGRDRQRRERSRRSRSSRKGSDQTSKTAEKGTDMSHKKEKPLSPGAPMPKAPSVPPPQRPVAKASAELEPLPTDEESWGKWLDQREGESNQAYMERLRRTYGKEPPKKPKKESVSASAAPSTPASAVPKAKSAAYYEVDGEWYWWDGEWGDKWEPKKKKKKKNKYTNEEWEAWYKEHPEDDPGTESSTPRSQKPAEPAQPPPTLRPRIRPGFDLIRRPDDPNQWMEHMLEVSMRMVEYIIQGEETKWMTTPPPVQGFDSPDEAVDL